jgi:hypothetical protein
VVETGGLEIPRAFSASLQISTLAYPSIPRFGVLWAALAAICATECATKRIVCNS